MPTKELSLFYSYKFVPSAFQSIKLTDIQNWALERQIQAYLTRGHQSFFAGRYQEALETYQFAYAMIYCFLHPNFPSRVAALSPSLLNGIDISKSLLAASGEVARFRQASGPSQQIVSPVDPPRRLTSLVNQYSGVGTSNPISPAQTFYQIAINYLKIGASQQAQRFLARARQSEGADDHELQAHLQTATGITLLHTNPADAAGLFTSAGELYNKLGLDSDVAVVNNNLGVALTMQNDARGAGAAFQAAGTRLPLDMGRTLFQPLNPGTASTMVRAMGSAGLTVALRSPQSSIDWTALPVAAAPAVSAQRLGVLVSDQVIDLNLNNDVIEELTAKIYTPRINARAFETLHTFEDLDSNFVAYLTHIHGFTLPMSLGDCYVEINQFDQALSWYQAARDYAFLNAAIEAPLLWVKMATCYLRWGNLFFTSQNKAEARVRYENIIRLSAPVLDPVSPLYRLPVFDAMSAQVQAILAAPTPLDLNVHNPAVASVVFLARLNLQNIQAGIDFPLLSAAREEVPVFSFEYLQNVARYFAQHAIDSERTYINFKNSAEQGTLNRSSLENAVDLERANERLEQKKVDIARAQQDVVDANVKYADTQLANAKDLKKDFGNVSAEEHALDSEITYVGSPTTEYNFSGYGAYGIPDGTHRADEVLRTLTSRRQQVSQKFELDNMDRRAKELTAAREVALAQQTVAAAQLAAANAESDVATLRRQQAETQLALFDSQEFTPDLWNRLANEIKAISATYLQQAIIIAKLMEQAFAFEIGEPVNVIKSGYTRNDLSGLLGGDFLLRDIDSFTFLRIVHANKKQPVKEIISLADRYPVQFLREFQKTGQMNFRTELSDFDRNYPGAYQQRIKRVEVVVEGLIGQAGIHGTLTNTGLCLTRLRSGLVKMRLLKPETLLLSSYRIALDSAVFSWASDTLATFENSPVSTSWVLDLRPSSNDLIYNYITDVKLVLYYETFFDEELVSPVLEEMAALLPVTGRRTVALRYELFDEFFAFQDTGEVRFTLRNTMLPFAHTQPVVRQLTILIRTDEGVSAAGLVVEVKSADSADASQTTGPDGAISTGAGTPLDVFIGQPWLQEWVVSIPTAPNQARFDAGFQLSQVNNIVWVTEYEFTPRRVAGDPFLLLRDEFAQDPLPSFDVVDDSQADVDNPSAWAYDAAARQLLQTSSIHGGPDGPAATDVLKAGTYLVRQSTPALPDVQDVILTSKLHSKTNGAIGLVFRWLDPDNFYFFLMDSQRNVRRLGKKVAGVFQELSTPAVDTTNGFIVGQTYFAKIRAQGSVLQVFLDDLLILTGQDASLPGLGRGGLLCWNNPGASFDDMQMIQL